MQVKRTLSVGGLATIALLLSWVVFGRLARASDEDHVQINFVGDQIAFEFTGEVTNNPPTPSAQLGSSNQYGYLTLVRGIDNLFSGTPHNETTALLTFFNEATTQESISNGPLRIIDRNGTTTIYLNSAPANFNNPDTFRAGIPVLIATLHQQVIVDTVDGTFTAVFENVVSSTSTSTINGVSFRLAQKGQAFRSTITGQLSATAPPPSGYFAGYAVGAGRQERHDQD
ncbi:hypothetical protein [Edaphobacter bradus]|uniref:hypothetical protein n=1 Tax=Edaphobacter bradus TaxID=2259016 RepID=UPI0021E0D235|nr:hypothetical protein [Edaphobacter bradus]